MWTAYVLKLTPETLGELTWQEFVNAWHAHIYRTQQRENMIAGLVTVWIANMAGKALNKTVQINDILKDGRFKRRLTEEDKALFYEIYGEEVR